MDVVAAHGMTGKPECQAMGTRTGVLCLCSREQKETKVWGKGSSCLRLPDALLLCGQELLETHSETCTIQMLCAGGNHFL